MTDETNGLSIKQTRALELTLKGMNDLEVAKRVKVSRQTVNEWRNQNLAFMEMLDMRRKMIHEQHVDSMNELVYLALGEVRRALHSQNEGMRLKAATLILRNSGLQGYMKPDKNAGGGKADFISELSAIIGSVAENLGYKDPTRPDSHKQLPDGKHTDA